jgi:hypothetical protein
MIHSLGTAWAGLIKTLVGKKDKTILLIINLRM